MKKYIISTIAIALTFFLATNTLYSQQLLEGTDYKIIAPEITSGGDILVDEGGDYQMISSLGRAISDPRMYSDSYKITTDNLFFEPHVPAVSCFETTTDGSSDCATGPSFLNSHGMVRVCGPEGCYDRARFEIDENNNPGDTLYGIQVSTDEFESEIKYVDGTTFALKDELSIEDFKTKTNWETETFNMRELKSDTEYSLRITALDGDFSQSAPSTVVTTKTAKATMSFKIGIAKEDGVNINYNHPYEILFDETFRITRGGSIVSSDRLIWTLINTNATRGAIVAQKGEHGGLHNPSAGGYTISSITGDLSSETEGIGLKNHTTSQLYYDTDTDGTLSTITTEVNYDSVEENTVGIIDNAAFQKTYESDGPIHTGETSLKLLTKAALDTPIGNYSENITLVLIPKY